MLFALVFIYVGVLGHIQPTLRGINLRINVNPINLRRCDVKPCVCAGLAGVGAWGEGEGVSTVCFGTSVAASPRTCRHAPRLDTVTAWRGVNMSCGDLRSLSQITEEKKNAPSATGRRGGGGKGGGARAQRARTRNASLAQQRPTTTR